MWCSSWDPGNPKRQNSVALEWLLIIQPLFLLLGNPRDEKKRNAAPQGLALKREGQPRMRKHFQPGDQASCPYEDALHKVRPKCCHLRSSWKFTACNGWRSHPLHLCEEHLSCLFSPPFSQGTKVKPWRRPVLMLSQSLRSGVCSFLLAYL